MNPAYDFVKRSLLAGKSVVTSNKELVAAKGDELLAIARDRNLNFLFEASVGGGIPILRPLDQCLAANEVYEIAGILNGTTNFVLTKMIDDGASFEDALRWRRSWATPNGIPPPMSTATTLAVKSVFWLLLPLDAMFRPLR